MDLMRLLKDQLNNPDVLAQLGKSVGADADQVSKLTQLGLPAMLEGLTKNTRTPEGAESLATALDQHKDDSVDDLEGFLNKVNRKDGAKILNHVFADKNNQVKKTLAKETGLKKGQVSGLLTQLAPVLLGALGNQKKEENMDAGGIASLLPSLGSLLGGASSSGGLAGITSILDADKDGDIVDDLKGFLGKIMK